MAHVLGEVPSVIDSDVNSKEVTQDGWHAILVMSSQQLSSSKYNEQQGKLYELI